jgi:hypothetical protein
MSFPVILPLAKENGESLYPGDPWKDEESLSPSKSHSLDFESVPAYSPSSCSTSPGYDSSIPCCVDMEPDQKEIPVHTNSRALGSSASMQDLGGGGSSEVSIRGMGEPSTSKPPIKCRPEWKELKNI